MRNTIVNLIYEEARTNPDIYFLTGDLGYSVIEKFREEFPERCLNLGIAEQNMMGAAAGLALEGKKVFVYSIVPFLTMRCMEQVRTDVALQNLDVTLVGVGGGFAYGSLGPTHHAIEDIAMMRVLPNFKIISPSDPVSAGVLGRQVLEGRGPFYLRLNKGKEPALYKEPPALSIGKGYTIKPGSEISIFSNGAILANVLEAARALEQDGISAEVIDVATVKPIDADLIKLKSSTRKFLVTVEEHSIIGGLGSAVAEVVSDLPKRPMLHRLGAPDKYAEVFGGQEYMRQAMGLSAKDIYQSIKRWHGRS